MVVKLVKEHGLIPILTLLFSISTTIIVALIAFIGSNAIAQIDSNRVRINANDKNIAILEIVDGWHDIRIKENNDKICRIENRKVKL